MKIGNLFTAGTKEEGWLRTATATLLLVYVALYSTVFEVHYPRRLVELYKQPYWRLIVVGLVGLGTWWCPRVGLALGLIVFFYLNDMDTLSSRI